MDTSHGTLHRTLHPLAPTCHTPRRRTPRRAPQGRTWGTLAVVLCLSLPAPSASATGRVIADQRPVVQRAEEQRPAEPDGASRADPRGASWVWPGGIARVVRPYEAPSHEYGPGHRGVDVAVIGDEIRAPDDGTVAFRGVVVDRPLITIDHGGGLVSTLAPVASELTAGDVVARGSIVGTLSTGGHAPTEALHLGARRHGEYLNPLALLGAVERPILLPCCG